MRRASPEPLRNLHLPVCALLFLPILPPFADRAAPRRTSPPAAPPVPRCFPGFPVPRQSEKIHELNEGAESKPLAPGRRVGQSFLEARSGATYSLGDGVLTGIGI